MTIRRTPGDFLVQERLGPEFERSLTAEPDAAAGRVHAVYLLRKTSLTTPEAVQQLAKAAGVRGGLGEYAGLKDKHAETEQHVSLRAGRAASSGGLGGAGGVAEVAPALEGRGWSARLVGWSDLALTAEAIRANRFTIVVRDLARETSGEIERRAGLLRDGAGGLTVVNYFGDQRFGSARHGEGFVARRIIADDYDGALKLAIGTPARKDTGKTRVFTRLCASHWGDWKKLAAELPRCPERRAIEALDRGAGAREAFAALPPFLQSMYVEAFQSHLWNATARGTIAALAHESGAKPLRSDDAFGEMLFLPASAVSEASRTLQIPLLARSTELREPWAGPARAALAEEGVSLEMLRVPGLRRPFFGEAPRTLFVRAAEFTLSSAERDEMDASGKRFKRTASFELPRGAYATVVLRALGH
ncbi:MAG: tRNA pseudouridine(13) synthase TruD [Planctomycetota bacterium]|nr:tRNA pseudouridine(13) synthase TruD [Planctomycetota bacterium]